MNALTRLRNNLSLSSIGLSDSWSQPPFWSVGSLLGGGLLGDREQMSNDFEGYAEQAYKANGILFTVILIRQHVLSEARFQFQRLRGGRPGDLWGDERLRLLDNPWPNGTTGELISRMEQDASLAGNFYAVKVDGRLRRLRPDWVTIVTESPGSPWDIRARVGGYVYQPPGDDPTLLTPGEVVHYSPIPDPTAQWRGVSWVTAVASEISADKAATKHKLKFFENGATSNVVITYDPQVSRDNVKAFSEMFADQYAGVDKAYKAIHLGGGADAKMVGADMKQLDFKVTQGAGESRIAAASLVGAVMAQFSEGMAGSSLNAGNFQAARRRFADVGARPLWRTMAASLASVVDVPSDSRLWYDDRDIPFLQDDAKDAAEIDSLRAQTIRTLVDGGFSPSSAVSAVNAQDFSALEHTNKLSVQLQDIDSEGSGLPPRDLAELVQKVYLGVVNDVVTRDEARRLLEAAGFPLDSAAQSNVQPASEE